MEKLVIRPAAEEDLPRLLEIYAPYIIRQTASFEYVVPSPEDFAARFRDVSAFYPWLTAEFDGEPVGYAYGSRAFERAAYSWDADVSVYVKEGFHGRKIGSSLYAELEKYLLRMGIRNLYAVITGENAGSRAFHEALGYQMEAKMARVGYKFGRWLDVYWYVKRLREDDPEALPISWKQL